MTVKTPDRLTALPQLIGSSLAVLFSYSLLGLAFSPVTGRPSYVIFAPLLFLFFTAASYFCASVNLLASPSPGKLSLVRIMALTFGIELATLTVLFIFADLFSPA